MKALLLAFLAMALTGAAAIAAPSDLEVSIPTSIAGKNYIFRIPLGSLYGTPPWKSTDAPPPLDPGKASIIAIAQMKQLFPQVTNWSLDAISLRRIKDDTRWNHWIYIVQLRANPDGSGIKSPASDIPVLMDGTTVAPVPVN